MMKKKRRERDRPKAHPNHPYNPSERVLLSYDSEPEDDGSMNALQSAKTTLVSAGCAQTSHEPTVSCVEPTDTAHGHSIAGSHGGEHSGEHSDDDLSVASVESMEADGQHISNRDQANRRVRASSITGQRPAIGPLELQSDDDGPGKDDATDQEAMDYLRAVRSERQHIPSLLFAAPENTNAMLWESVAQDSRGFLQDGVYSSRPKLGPQLPPKAKVLLDPQDVYTERLLEQFERLHERLQLAPTPAAATASSDEPPVTSTCGHRKLRQAYMRAIDERLPSIAHLQRMDGRTVFKVLELIADVHVSKRHSIEPGTSAWIYGLLARLDDVGLMNNDQVYVLRELGKRAAAVLGASKSSQAGRQSQSARETRHTDDNKHHSTSVEETEATFESSDPSWESDPPCNDENHDRSNSAATLDMILTIVGQRFGQRDLLELRKWSSGP